MFEVVDEVKIISKSTGRTLISVKENSKYDENIPQKITSKHKRFDGTMIYNIRGDHYLEKDLLLVGTQLSFKFMRFSNVQKR